MDAGNLPALAELRKLAFQINDTHAQLLADAKIALDKIDSALRNALLIGSWLLQAKKSCGHGKFDTWLAAYCPKIGRTTAWRYMRLANFPHVENLNAITLRQAFIEAGILPGIQRLSFEGGSGKSAPRVKISLPPLTPKMQEHPLEKWDMGEAQTFRKWFDKEVEPLRSVRDSIADIETTENNYSI